MFVYKWYTPCTVVNPHPKPPNNAREYSKGKSERGAERTSLRRFWLVLSRLRERVCTGPDQARPAGNRARERLRRVRKGYKGCRGGCTQCSLALALTLSLFILLSRESESAERGEGGLWLEIELGQRRIRFVTFSRSVVPCSFVRSLLSFGFDSPFGCVSRSRTFIYNFLTPLHRFLCSILSSLRICCVLGFFQLNNNKSNTHTHTIHTHTHQDTERNTDTTTVEELQLEPQQQQQQ